jgi:hypothetical protein
MSPANQSPNKNDPTWTFDDEWGCILQHDRDQLIISPEGMESLCRAYEEHRGQQTTEKERP